MKKIFKYLLLFIFIVPIKVFAFGIDNYIMDIDILDNGDILVEEYFELNGEYNGFERILEYENKNCLKWNPNDNVYGGSCIHNGTGLVMKEIREVDYNSNFDFNNVSGKLYKEVISVSKGDSGVYTNSGSSYMIYHPSNLNKAFYLKYVVENVGIVHNDVGEFGFNVIGNSLNESINNFKVIIHIPNNKDELKVWAHGPKNGNIKIIDKETVEASIRGINVNTPIDVRLVFDKDVISNSKKLTNVNALEKIFMYENKNVGENISDVKLKTEEKALSSLKSFESNINRDYYYYARYNIEMMYNDEEKEEYLIRLLNSKKILDKQEQQKAIEYLNYLEKLDIEFLDYSKYNLALEYIEILDNKELKDELLIRLDKQRTRFINKNDGFKINKYIIGISSLILVAIIIFFVFAKFVKKN